MWRNRYHPAVRSVNGVSVRPVVALSGLSVSSRPVMDLLMSNLSTSAAEQTLPPTETADTIVADHPVVGCDGGGDELGHPLVYLRIGASRDVVCPYCSRHYVLRDGVEAVAGH